MTGPVPRRWRGFQHLTPYHRGNSIRGLQRAVRRGRDSVDLDFRVTRDGVVVNTHWPRPLAHGFIDPTGKLATHARIEDLTAAQVARLRTRRGGYRIHTAERILTEAAQRGLKVEFEAKDSHAFTDPGVWADLARLVRVIRTDAGPLPIIVKTLSNRPDPATAGRRLKAAKIAGFRTMLLPRGRRTMPEVYRRHVDYVRGWVRWVP